MLLQATCDNEQFTIVDVTKATSGDAILDLVLSKVSGMLQLSLPRRCNSEMTSTIPSVSTGQTLAKQPTLIPHRPQICTISVPNMETPRGPSSFSSSRPRFPPLPMRL